MSQTIFRRARPSRYSVVGNDLINNPLLSMKAKGILIYLLSKPESWKAVVEDIVSHCTDGSTAVRSGLKELENAGYLRRECVRNSDGTVLRWEILVYEDPVPPDDAETTSSLPRSGLSRSGKSTSGKAECIYSTDQQSTDQQSTDQQSTKKEGSDFQDEIIPESSLVKVSGQLPDYWQQVVALYNANKPDLWAKLLVLNEARLKALRRYRKELGDPGLLAAIESACKFAEQDTWWGSKGGDLDKLLRDNRLVSFAESYQAVLDGGGIHKVLEDPKQREALQRRQRIADSYPRALSFFGNSTPPEDE